MNQYIHGIACLDIYPKHNTESFVPDHLSIPSRLRNLPEQHISPQLPILISHRIMQRMCPNIPPEPIQPNLQACRSRSRHLKHPIRNPQPRIRRNNLNTRNPLRNFSTLARSQCTSVRPIGTVEGRELLGSAVG